MRQTCNWRVLINMYMMKDSNNLFDLFELRQDGRTICWGGVTSSYTGAIDIGLSDSSSVIAVRNLTYTLDC